MALPLPSFRPEPKHWDSLPSLHKDIIPTYLFRVYSPESYGETSTTCVEPSAPLEFKEDIFAVFERDPPGAVKRLNDHLQGDPNNGHGKTCNLTSWTSSLLVGLLHGVFLMEYCKEKAENIKLLIIDTQGMPRGTFVKDTEIMSVFVPHEKHVPSEGWSLGQLYTIRQKEHRFGEYLSQGKVDIRGKADETSFRTMMDSGLGVLYPWLFDHSLSGKWANRVLHARNKYLKTPSLPAGCVQKAIRVAQKSFGEFQALPVAVMFLALERRPQRNQALLDAFKATFSDDQGCLYFLSDKPIIYPEALAEVESFNEILDYIQEGFKTPNPELTDMLLGMDRLALDDEDDTN